MSNTSTKRGIPLGGKYQGIYQKTLADGSQRFTVRIKYRKPNGQEANKTGTFPTLREAKKFRDRIVAERALGTVPVSTPTTSSTKPTAPLAVIAKEYLSSRKEKRSYRDMHHLLFGTYGIVDSFGEGFDLATIKDSHITWFKEEILNKRRRIPTFKGIKKSRTTSTERSGDSGTQQLIANKTKNDYLMYLQGVLKKARSMGLIRYLPEITLYPLDNCRDLVIDLPTFSRILALMPLPPKPHRAMLLMAVFTGQRWNNLATMKQQQIRGEILAGTMLEYHSTKNKRGIIRLPLPEMLAHELRELSKFRKEDNPLMFFNPHTGKPYTSLKKPLATACKKLGIAPFEFYQFRHLCGTEYLRELKDVNAVANVLGHKNSRMVDQRYGHIVDRAHPGMLAIERDLHQLNTAANTP